MKKYNPDNYQGVDSDGVLKGVASLTKKELRQNLCMSMDAIERIEYNMSIITGIINEWRDDKLKPEYEQ